MKKKRAEADQVKPPDQGGKQRKSAALRTRMKQQGMTAVELAQRLQMSSRDAITTWRMGKSWPRPPTEHAIEAELQLPPGFFAQIGAGIPYERALHEKSPTVSDPITTTIEQYRQLLLLAPTDAEAQRQLERVRAHLQNQIALLFDLMRHSLKTETWSPSVEQVDGGSC